MLVVIAIIVILAAILFPVFAKVKEKARQLACASNLKQLALAMLAYALDYGALPLGGYGNWGEETWWMSTTRPYTKNVVIERCPSDLSGTAGWLGYGYNWEFLYIMGPRLEEVASPAETVMLCDVGLDDAGKEVTHSLLTHPVLLPLRAPLFVGLRPDTVGAVT